MSRVKRISGRQLARIERGLAEVTTAARSLLGAQSSGACPERIDDLAYYLKWQASNAKHYGATREQVAAALDRGGMVDEGEQAARQAMLEDVSAALPEDLQRIIRGETCRSSA